MTDGGTRTASYGSAASVLTAEGIARETGGRLIGDPAVSVRGAAPLDRAAPSDLSFLAKAKYADGLRDTRAGVVLIAPELAELDAPNVSARVVIANPYDALQRLLPRLYPAPGRRAGIHPTAVIGRGATVGRGVSLGAFAVVGPGAHVGDDVSIGEHCVVDAGVRIGANSTLHASVTLYSGTVLGDRVTIHAGTRIGCDGFGYVQRDGAHQRVTHVGRCLIENDVEIGANTAIDRGSIDDTIVGAGTKIDNLVHIAHNVHIGRACLIMAQVGVAGSARIGDGCVLAGQAGVGGHLTIGNGARIAARGGVICDVPAGETWSGYPARPHREALRASAALFKLSGLIARLERFLEKS